MRKTIALMLISTLVLGGCGGVRSWFGGGREVQTAEPGNPLIPTSSGMMSLNAARAVYRGNPVGQITALNVERIPGGAIIRVEAVADRQGPFNVRMVPATPADTPQNGVLAYTLAAELPRRSPVGTPATRRIVAAHYVADDALAGTSEIRVSGARNTLSSRR
ncbi:hypothetical protein [Pseudooceanicola sp.]|jgi:hypothetical protein|uniref:hypothetical protein n=1 Tax=Pseudooceanicola TaxID=1679449 RepID=UPI0035188ED7